MNDVHTAARLWSSMADCSIQKLARSYNYARAVPCKCLPIPPGTSNAYGAVRSKPLRFQRRDVMPVPRCPTIVRSCSLVFVSLAVMSSTASESHAKTWPTPTLCPMTSSAWASLPSSAETTGPVNANHVAMYKVSRLLERVKGFINKVGGRHQNSPPPVMSESATALTFTAMEGGANPSNQTFTITNSGGGTLSWTLSDNASWLTVSPTSGATTTEADVVTVSVNISGLSGNTYTGVVTLSGQGKTLTSQQVPVTLILSPAAPTISQSPTSLTFTAMEGGSNPTAQTIAITNPGTGTLNWTAGKSASWLTLTPSSGTTTTETDKITVAVNASGLTSNTYAATITVSDPAASNNAQQIPITLALTAPQSGMATLTWAANSDSDLAGYKVYIGTSTGSYPLATDVGNTTTHKVGGLLSGKTYYFAVTAYSTSGSESGYSNEASKTMP